MAGSLRQSGPLQELREDEKITADDLLGRPEDQVAAHQGDLLDPNADFERGLQSAGEGMRAGHYYRAADFAERDGDIETATELREFAARNERGAEAFSPRVSSTADVDGVGSAIDYAQGALGQAAPSIVSTTAPAIVGAVVGGAVGSVVPGVGTAFGAAAGSALFGGKAGFDMEAGEAAASQYADEIIRDLPVDERIKEQNYKGLQGMALELILPSVIGGRIFSSVAKVGLKELKKQGAKGIGKTLAKNTAKDTFVEGATEGSQALVGQASLARLNPERDTSGDMQETLDSIVMGALAGGGISLGTGVPSALVQAAPKTLPNIPKIKGKGEKPGVVVPDSTLQERAAGGGEGPVATVSDAQLDDEAAPKPPPPPPPAAAPEVKTEPEGGKLSDAELERRARIRKSAFGTRIPGPNPAEESRLRKAEPEEITQLRELRPVGKDESKQNRRYIRRQPADVEAFMKKQVKRGVISQEVADSAVVEPLGQSMKRKKASIQDMENEIGSIVRDLMTRIQENKKKGDVDFAKGLMSELENLPINVQRKGEKTTTFEKPIVGVEEKNVLKPGPKRDGKQGELFPETIGEPVVVPVKEFKRNHFGEEIVVQRPEQAEMNLDNGESYKALLVKALDEYSVVLASDASLGAQAATEAQTKARRRSIDSMTQQQRQQAGRQDVTFKLENGQNRVLDLDDMINSELAADRSGVEGHLRSTKEKRLAALRSAIASELMREDVAGVIGPDGNLAKGSKIQDLLGDYVLDAKDVAENPKAETKVRNRAQEEALRAETGIQAKAFKQHPFVRQLMKQASSDKSRIQKVYNKAVKELGGERNQKQRIEQVKALREAAKAQRDLVKQARKIAGQASYMDRVNQLIDRGKSKGQAHKLATAALTKAYGPELTKMIKVHAQQAVATFRAERLEALAEHLSEVQREGKRVGPEETGDIRYKGLKGDQKTKLRKESPELQAEQANTKAERQIRHAEDHTGADNVLKVGTPMRGKSPSRKAFISNPEEIKQVTNFIEQYPGGYTTAGNVAEASVRTPGIPIAHFKDGETVPVVLAEVDVPGFFGSRKFNELTGRGLTIAFPTPSSKLDEGMRAAGYKRVGPRTWAIYKPTVGFERALGQHRNQLNSFSQRAKVSGLTPSLEAETFVNEVMASAFGWKEVFEKGGEAAKKAIDSKVAKKAEEWIRAQVEKGVDIDGMLEKAKGFVAKANNPTTRAMWEKVVKAIEEQRDSLKKYLAEQAAESRKLAAETKTKRALGNIEKALNPPEDALRAKIVENIKPGSGQAMGMMMQAVQTRKELRQAADPAEAAKQWYKDNFEDLVDILYRRAMLEKNPLVATDYKFMKDLAAQVDFLQKTFGKAASRIAPVADPEATLDQRFDLKINGEKVDISKMDNRIGAAALAFIRKFAPMSMTTLTARGYFDALTETGRQIQRVIAGEVSVPMVLTLKEREGFSSKGHNYRLRTDDGLNNSKKDARKKEFPLEYVGGDELVNHLFGEEHVGKSIEELMDVQMLNIDTLNKGSAQGKIAKLRDMNIGRARGMVNLTELTREQLKAPLPPGVTLRQMMEMSKWFDENVDSLDIEFTGDLEFLKTQNFGVTGSASAMGMYNPTDDRIFLLKGALTSRFMAAWTAWHELGHRGLAVEHGVELQAVLEKAAKNPTLAKMAKAIRLERSIIGDHSGAMKLGSVEEALVELGAALEVENGIAHLELQYGVKISENLQKPLAELWSEFKALMKKVMKKLLKHDPSFDEMKSDIDVLEILKAAKIAATETATNRPKAAEGLKKKGIDLSGLRFSEQNETLDAALSEQDRATKQQRITEFLTNVLGDRVRVLFQDITSDDQAAGWFDWAQATIGLALNTTNAEGVARHEAFHAFFNALGKLDKDRAIYDRLLKAANAPHIKRQLRTLLADSPEALAQLRDPEERAAYMFQFYASGELNVTPTTFKTLRKWAKNLAKIVGYTSRFESSEQIFEAFNNGHLKSDEQIVNMIREQQHKALARDIQKVMRPINKGLKASLLTATDRMRVTNNKSLMQLADLFASTVKNGGMAGYIAMRGQKEAQINNLFNEALDKHTKGKENKDEIIENALKELQSMKAPEELSPLGKELRAIFKGTYTYLRDQQNDTADGVSPNAVQYIIGFELNEDGSKDYNSPIWGPIKHNDRYFPRVWDAKVILGRWTEFATLLKNEGGMSDDAINDFKRTLQNGDGMMDMSTTNPTFDAAMRAVNDRVFDFIQPENAHKFAEFQEQDMTSILTTYARQAAHRGEQTRHFGYDNQEIKRLLKEARLEGATVEEMKTADKAVRALEGTLGHETMTPLKKNAMMTAMTVVNLAVLPLALFSSLVDPLGVAVRTGDFKQAGKTFIAGARQVIGDTFNMDPTEAEKLAKFLGTIEQEQVLSVVGDSYNSMFANEQLQKINTRFFKMIGLDSWTKGTRIGATVASMEYLAEYKDDAKRMEELGLEPGDIVIAEDGQVELRPNVLGQDKARRVQGAVYRMVDESILRPTAAQRPIFMSDMRFMLLGHLKQFTFSFHNTIVKQVVNNINDNLDNKDYVKAMTQLLPLLSYVPFMMAADVLRSIVGGRIDDEDDKDMGDYLWDGFQRSAVFGLGTFGMDAADDIGYGGAPINTFLGPVIHKGARLVEAGIDPDEQFTKQAVRMLPGYAFWKGWLE